MALYFNDVSGGQGVCQEMDDQCDSDADSYPLASKARRVNSAVLKLELKAMFCAGGWRFDDTNNGVNQTGLQTLVSGTQEYIFDSTLMFIESVEVLLADGVTWQKLTELDPALISGSPKQYLSLTGLPMQYYKRGNYLGLTPIPVTGSVTLINGLRVTFTRRGSLFTAADTTKTPGIEPTFHELVALMASLPYCKTYKKDRVPQLVLDIQEQTKEFEKYYSSRSKDNSGGGIRFKRINGR